MEQETISISCPGCGAVFDVPTEMGGEVGECTECGTTFEIPLIEADEPTDLNTTDTGTIQVQESGVSETTNTVKLSRTSIGMIPNVQSNFKVDVVQRPSTRTSTNVDIEEVGDGKNKAKIYTKTADSLEKVKFKKPPSSKNSSDSPQPTHPPKATTTKKKWWQFWKK